MLKSTLNKEPGRVVMCLTADTCLTADPGVAKSILAQSHFLVETDHEIISTSILLPSTGSRKVVVIYSTGMAMLLSNVFCRDATRSVKKINPHANPALNPHDSRAKPSLFPR